MVATPAFKTRVREIMDHTYKENPAIAKQYGFTNEAEFMAEAISSPIFQNELKKIKSDGKKGNVFNEIVKIFSNILKRIGHGEQRSALTDALDVALQLNKVELPGFEGDTITDSDVSKPESDTISELESTDSTSFAIKVDDATADAVHEITSELDKKFDKCSI
jgi:hypothetical protein